MKRLLSVFLVLSMISIVIPSQVVAHGPEVRNHNRELVANCKLALSAAITLGTVAAALYMYTPAAAPLTDCNLVAQAHCAGAQVPWPLLDQCKDQLQSAQWPICLLKYYWSAR